MKVLIIGGVAGGATAAARIRRLDEHAQIVILERSGFVSYANCGLPYYVGGAIEDSADLTVQTPEGFRSRYRIDARVLSEAVEIRPETKTVLVKDLRTGKTYEESYDKLILSPGAKPVVPPGADVNAPGVFTVRSVEDTLAIRKYIEDHAPKKAVIAGGGFIGLEMAENLIRKGIDVTVLQGAKHMFMPLDEDMAMLVHSELYRRGIHMKVNARVETVNASKDGLVTTLATGESISSELVILAIGVLPETHLAADAGLKLGVKNSILVNEHMQTSDPDIYAVGDAVTIRNHVTQKDGLTALAGPANKQARIAADHICGKTDHAYKGTLASSIIRIFDLSVATTGINETIAKSLGYSVDKVILSPASHASYYPGATVMTMKVLADHASGKLLGAQIIGHDGVDKRIDVLATALFAGMNATDLKDLDLAYAPPYSSAKDPVNMAGFMLENLQEGTLRQYYYEDLPELIEKGDSVTLLDVRTPFEYMHGHADGFVNLELDELRDRLGKVPKDKPVYVMCQSGMRSYLAYRILVANGYEAYNFAGGYRFYQLVENGKKTTAE
ncbi:MAG: FAD-dependent oxidoreductase [Lachnospiraceae bacterium]|nr:FAD-dependent oxidoreductase [Lachnospiraceae bacterium]